MQFTSRNISPFSLLIGIAFLVLLLGGLFFVFQGVYLILMYLSPVLLVAALLLDHKVILSYGQWLLKKFKSNFIGGVSWTLISLFGFPFVSALLCFRAYISYRSDSISQDANDPQGEYIEYEIVEEEEDSIEIGSGYHRK